MSKSYFIFIMGCSLVQFVFNGFRLLSGNANVFVWMGCICSGLAIIIGIIWRKELYIGL